MCIHYIYIYIQYITEFVQARLRKKALEIKEFTCIESLQGSSGFGRTGLPNKKKTPSILKDRKRRLSRLLLYSKIFFF